MARQLQMTITQQKLHAAPSPVLPAGYELRTYHQEDATEFVKLMESAGFERWNETSFATALMHALPDGIFIAVEAATGDLAASAMATHNPAGLHQFGGELGWVAAHPKHRGRHLGTVVCSAVLRRYAAAGYRRVYLKTDDFRLPAIKTYLRLGFVPLLFSADMPGRWRAVCDELGIPFTPERWESVPLEAEPEPAQPGSAQPVLARTAEILREARPVRMVLYGDSISESGRTQGWFGGAADAASNWGSRLAALLNESRTAGAFEAIHFGIGGQNTYEGLGRLDDLAALKPDLVLVEFGANDMGWHHLQPDETRVALKTLVEWIRIRHGADVVVVGSGGDNPLQPTLTHVAETLAAQCEAAQECGVPFADVRRDVLAATLDGKLWESFHNGQQDCHPNDKGHAVWARAAFNTIVSHLPAGGEAERG